MTPDTVLALAQHALLITLYISGPMMAVGLLVGLIIGVLQAVTNVQEATLSYIPKMVAIFGVFIVLMPWLLRLMIGYSASLLGNLSRFAR